MALIRKSVVENSEALRKLAIKIFRETFQADNNPADFEKYMSEAFTEEKIRSEYSEEGSQYFEAMENNEMVGYARLRINNEVNDLIGEKHLELMRIYVDSPWQGKGIALQLLQACEDHAKNHSKDWIWLGVWEHNPKAIHFYKKHGYIKFGEHKFMIGSDEQTDWLMKKSLK